MRRAVLLVMVSWIHLSLTQNIMIDWISKKRREEKRREAHERQLKKSLAEKISQYEQSNRNLIDHSPEDDFTELFIDGKKRRVAKEQITITGD